MKLRNILNTLLISSVIFLFCVSSLVLATPTQFTYENKAMGIKLAAPEGWLIIQSKIVQKEAKEVMEFVAASKSIKENIEKSGLLVAFRKYPLDTPREFNPLIMLAVTQISPAESKVSRTAIDFANDKLNSIINSKALKDVRTIKEPTKIMFGNYDGANFIFEATTLGGKQETRLRFSFYQIIKENIVYSLSFRDKAEDFDNNLAAFEASVNTFVIK